MNKKNYFLLFLFFLGSFLVRAQNITVVAGDMPASVTACGDVASFKVNVFGPLAAGSVITTTLPTGSSFNSLVSSGVTATATATGVKFTLTSALATAADKITIEYTVNTSCTVMTAGAQITYATGSVTKTQAYPAVDYSLLEVTGVSPASATINVYGTQNYTVTVKQSAATYSNNVKINITHSTKVTLTAPVGTLTLGTPSGGTQTDVLELTGAQIAAIGDGDTRFEQNETITAVVAAKLIACTTGETLKFQAAYGCGTYTACTTGNITNAGLAQNSVGNPNLTMTQTKAPMPGFSPGEPDTATYVLTNNGAGPAYNVKVQLGFSSSGTGYTPTKRAYLNFYDFKVNGNAMNDDANDVAQFDFSSDPDGAGVGLDDLDGDGQYDDLPAGKSVTINAMLEQTVSTFSQDCLVNYNSGSYDIMRWQLRYTNACATATNYSEPNNGLGANRPFSLANYTNSVGSISSTGANLNFVAGDTFTGVYTIGFNYTSLSTLHINSSQAFLRIRAIVPPGVVPTGTATFSLGGYTITYNAAVSDPANNTYYYDLVPTTNTTANLAATGTVNLPLLVTAACNTNGGYDIKFSMQLYQSPTILIVNKFACINSPAFTLGCATPQGLGIDSWDMKRQTLGYTDATETVHVTESTSGINLNAYLNGDKALAAYQLTIYDPAMQSAKVVMEYNKDNWLKNGVANGGIKGISGSYTDPVTSVVTPFTIPAASLSGYYTYTNSYTGADGLTKSGYTFDILKLFQTGGPLAAITPQANAKLVYNADFVVNEDYFNVVSNGQQIDGFNSYTPVTLSGGTATIGNYKADLARLFPYFITSGFGGLDQSVNVQQCAATTIRLNNQFSYFSKYGDIFPNENRYNSIVNQMVVLLPAGISMVPGSAKQSVYSSALISIPDPQIAYGFDSNGTPNPNGLYNKYTFTNNGSWIRQDASASYDYSYVQINFYPNNKYNTYLATYPTNFVEYLIGGSAQYSLNFDTPRTVTYPKGYSLPTTVKMFTYVVSSSGANVTTATNTASWPLTVTNTNSGSEALPNFWIAIEVPNNNITPTLWDGATQIPLVSYGTGKYWAKIGNLTAGAHNYTLKSSSFSICGTDNFVVKTGFDCIEYPTNPAQGYPTQGNTTPVTKDIAMSLTTQNPALTISSSVNSSGTDKFDICNNIDETLTVTNGANGYAYNIEPLITLPVGMSFVANSFKLNYGSTDYTISDADVTLVSGTTYKVNIYNSAAPFVSTGLPGTSNSVDPNTFILKYKVSTLCTASGNGNYTSGSRINYTVNGQSGCGYQLPLVNGQTVIRSQPINLNGAAYDNKLESLETDKTKANHHVNDEEELVVTVINQGDPTGNFESIKILVDDAYDYVAGSTVLQAGNTFAGFTAVDPSNTVDASGQRVLEWTVPTGFTSGQTILFNFKVKATDASAMACEATHIMAMNTYVGSAPTCAINGEVCNLQFPTGVQKEVSLLSFTPAIGAVINSSVFGSNAGNTTYNINYTITNQNATYVVKPQLNIKLYNDVNSDGLLDAGDTLLDTKTTVGTVAALGTLTETITGSYSGSASKLLLSYESNNTVSNICTPVVKSINAYCYKPAATTGGSVLDTKHGITALGRAGADADNWPMVRKGAWTVLEAKTKGFVINRIASTAAVNTIANPIEGMMVYDEEADCLKIYVIDTAVPANTGWKCFNTQACPD